MFKKILNQNIVEILRPSSLLKSFRISSDFQCIFQCSKNDLCSIAIVDSSICNIYIIFDLNDSNLINSPTSTIYVKNNYNEINKYLIHYWPFNGNYFDVISNANLFNGFNDQLVSDRFGRASSSVYLNYGSLQAPDGIYIYGDFTLTAWVKMHSLEQFRRLFFLISPNNIVFSLTQGANTGPYFYSSFYNQDQVSNTTLTIGKWQHLAFTIKGSTLSIYIDGVIVFEGLTVPLSVVNRSDIRIGSEGHYPANADFDDLKIFNKSLSQAEIIQSSLVNL
jgi:hypothetical protein